MMDVTSAGRYLDKFGVGLTHRAESGYMLEIQVCEYYSDVILAFVADPIVLGANPGQGC